MTSKEEEELAFNCLENCLEVSEAEIRRANLSEEQLVEIYVERASFAAEGALEIDENYYREHCTKLLSDKQRENLKKIVYTGDLTDKEAKTMIRERAELNTQAVMQKLKDRLKKRG